MNAPELSIVIPVFNEAGNLAPLTDELIDVLERLGRTFEIVYVDDGSTDGSADELLRLAYHEPEVRVLRFSANAGQSAALAAGLGAAGGRFVVTLDADLQNDPADIPRLLTAMSGHDVVCGVRADRQDRLARRLAGRIANRVRRMVLRDGISDIGCSLKAYRADLLVDVPAFDGLHRFLPAILKARGARITELRVSHRPRRRGSSKYTIGGRLWRGIMDVAGVRWLVSRRIEPRAAKEIEVWTTRTSGTRSASRVKRSFSRASSSSGSLPNAGSGA